MKNIVFICPYFGKFPNMQMNLWLESCKKNPNIDWLIFTDDITEYQYPKNVIVKYMNLKDFKNIIQKKISFKIALDFPYKLCDYKPVYGYALSEYISEYMYWGYCDITDCMFGELEKFLLSFMQKGYGKIGFLGHMTLYKNTSENNELFKDVNMFGKNLTEILGYNKHIAFDENNNFGINKIFERKEISFKRIDEIYVDISTRFYSFRVSKWDKKFEHNGFDKKRFVIEWDNGRLFKYYLNDNKIKKEEIGYVHYQKRKMNIKFNMDEFETTKKYIIVPNKFIIERKNLTVSDIKKYTKEKLINWTYIYIKLNRIKFKIKQKLKDI